MKRLVVVLLLLSSASLAGCSSSNDGDGLKADLENRGWPVSVTYPNETTRNFTVTSDPKLGDTDSDGLDDFAELNTADPRDIDTDHDRLLDGPVLCPDSGSKLLEEIQRRNILQHPTREGCYLGESNVDIGELSYDSDPADAFTDRAQGTGDGLSDTEELVGWKVTVAGETRTVRSNPSRRALDSDGDNLVDGAEKLLGTDPLADDTDGDGTNDFLDSDPTANLQLTVELDSINLKNDFEIGGGANLRLDVRVGQNERSKGPKHIDQGQNRLGWSMQIDVDDEGTDFTEDGDFTYAAGNWEKEVSYTFIHVSSTGDNEAIEVKSGKTGHVLRLEYDAFDEAWSGDARGGTSSGPDADVTLGVTTQLG